MKFKNTFLKKFLVLILCVFLAGNFMTDSFAFAGENVNTMETVTETEDSEESSIEETGSIEETETETTEERESAEETESETEKETESPKETESESPAETEPETQPVIVKRPDAPKMKLMETTRTSVRIGWEKVKNADGYLVYQKKNGKWTLLKKTNAKTFSYQVSGITSSKKIIFTVRAFKGNLKSKLNASGIEAARKVSGIKVKSIYISSSGKGTVTWEKNPEADGYAIYRKLGKNGSWKIAGYVNADKNSFSETGLLKNKQYCYFVKGYRILNRVKVKGLSGNAMTNIMHDTVLNNVTKTYLGDSGAGRRMYSYTVGTGKNHLVVISAIHGYEDNWKKDSCCLIETARELILSYSKKVSYLDKYHYSLIVIPIANPDGYADGYTCNGPGRCTTCRFNANGNLIKGGLDLNRCFPVGFKALYNARNYTGPVPLMAKEAKILKSFLDENKGSGKNIFVDMQGWYGQIITKYTGSGTLYRALKKYFPSSSAARLAGSGYIASYAQYIGYDAVLFEFPRNVTSKKAFYYHHYDTRFINALRYMMNYR